MFIGVPSIGVGAYSFGSNVLSGNWGAAAVDLGGIIADVGATLTPGVPGVVGLSIKAKRTAKALDKAPEKNGKSFDQAREEAFEKAGMTDPSDVSISKTDEVTGTATEFKGPNGAKVGYDGPHQSPGPHHDSQHISWQSGGKRGQGGAQRGNIPYDGDRHPSRPDRKDQ